jgi:hypothetical protein
MPGCGLTRRAFPFNPRVLVWFSRLFPACLCLVYDVMFRQGAWLVIRQCGSLRKQRCSSISQNASSSERKREAGCSSSCLCVAFPFEVRCYPAHGESDSQVVFTGQLHRGFRICSSAEAFIAFVGKLAERLQRNGCLLHRLRSRLGSFYARQPRKFEECNPLAF